MYVCAVQDYQHGVPWRSAEDKRVQAALQANGMFTSRTPLCSTLMLLECAGEYFLFPSSSARDWTGGIRLLLCESRDVIDTRFPLLQLLCVLPVCRPLICSKQRMWARYA